MMYFDVYVTDYIQPNILGYIILHLLGNTFDRKRISANPNLNFKR